MWIKVLTEALWLRPSIINIFMTGWFNYYWADVS